MSGRAELRPLAEGDEDELLRIHRTPEVARWWDEPCEGFPWDERESARFTILVDGRVAGMIQFAEETEPATDNAAAIRSYEKAGFKPVGVMRRHERDADGQGWHDSLLMELLAGDGERRADPS